MILNYKSVIAYCLNKKNLYGVLDNGEYPRYEIEDIVDGDVMYDLIHSRFNSAFYDDSFMNGEVYTVEFDSLEELKEKYDDALKICSCIEENYSMDNINISFRIDNNFRLNKDNFKEILDIKNKIENEGYNFVFSEVVGLNESEWTLEEVASTNEKLDGIVNNIKQMNLSPLEKVLYAYNLVANLKTYKENAYSKGDASRSIYAILDNDECVCMGYAQLLEAIINRLDDKSLKAYTNCLSMKSGGHANNLVYINDEKYGVDGYYVFDSTGDSYNDKYREMLEEKYKLIYFMLPISVLPKMVNKKYKASYKWSNKNIVSFDGDVFLNDYVDLLKKEQVGFDKDIDFLNEDNAVEYFKKKSKAFDKSKFIELFTTTFPSLSVTDCKKIFRNNELWCMEKFEWDSDEVIFYDSEFEDEITENKKTKR